MSRFFKTIQNYFSDSHSGRYLALLLCELAHAKPEAFRRAFKNIGYDFAGNCVVRREWSFKGVSQRRLADLAILTAQGDPILLIEIKDADGKLPNEAQLRDYWKYLEKYPRTKFLYLTRHVLNETDELEFRKAKNLPAKHKRFKDYY